MAARREPCPHGVLHRPSCEPCRFAEAMPSVLKAGNEILADFTDEIDDWSDEEIAEVSIGELRVLRDAIRRAEGL